MYSAYKLIKQGDNMQLLCTPFPIWNHYVVPCSVLTLSSRPAYRFLWRTVRWSHLFKNFPQFVGIHIVKGFRVVNEAEVDVFLELSCFFYDSMDVGNLISGSSAFSKSSLEDGRVEGHVLIFSYENVKIATCCWTTIDRRMFDSTKKW